MALDRNALEDAILDMFTGIGGYPQTVGAAGDRWASVYAGYASDALANITTPVAATVESSAATLGDTLAIAFSHAADAGGTAIGALVFEMVAAFSAFWPTVGFAAPGVVGVAAPPLPDALGNALGGFFADGNPAEGPRPGAGQQAASLATLLDAWTRTVVVVNTPTGGLPLPPVPLT
jgi:hypothetical protein